MKHFSMKRNIFSKCLYGMMALGLLASCSNEPLLEDNTILENETTAYVRISLMGEGIGSRATDETDYEYGSEEESAVKTLILKFYNGDREFICSETIDMTTANSYEVEGNGQTIEKIITIVAPVNLPEKAYEPKWVMAFVNPTKRSSDLNTKELETLMARTRERNEVSPDMNYRTMNNSVYFQEESGRMRYATPVNFKDQFYLSENDAKAPNANAIEITVERVEAKVRVSLPEDNKIESVEAKDDKNTYSLQFVPQAWFVNATEKRTFLIKNYRATETNYATDDVSVNAATYSMSFNTLNETFEKINEKIKKDIPFNSEANLRSFWAIDPTYFGGTGYPAVSYDVNYGTIGNDGKYSINPDGKVYTLEYRSYNDVMRSYGTTTNYVKYSTTGGITTKSHEYVLENTMDLATLQSSSAMAAMTSVELIGYYKVTKGDQTVFDGSTAGDKDGFYIRHEGSAASPTYKIMLNDNEAIDYFLQHAGNMLYVKKRNNDGTETGEFETLIAGHLKENRTNNVEYGVSYDDFKIEYPKSSKISEQWRSLSLSDAGKTNENIYIIDNTTGEYKKASELTTNELADLHKHFYDIFGVVERFTQGKAHFTVPLKHLWNPNNTSNTFNINDVDLGYYGVVRNHVYDLTINKISGLGSGIGDPEQPIVPPTDNQQYYISTKLNILKWRNVSQSVDL